MADDSRVPVGLTPGEIIRIAFDKLPAEMLAEPAEAEALLAYYVSQLRRLGNERSVPCRIANCVAVMATVTDVAYEESSTRYVITFLSDSPNREGERRPETVRSDRTDGLRGQFVVSMWQDAAGQRAVIYKTTEATGRPAKPSIGVAPYVQLFGPAQE